MEIKSSGSASKAFAVFLKDFKSELRTRYAINAILMFAVVTVFAVSYFSSLSGLSQSFVKEEESKTALALRLYCPASAVLGGKMIFNLILLSVLNLLTIPLFGIFIGLEIYNFPLFIIIVILGSLGIVATTTLAAAIISKASVKGALFAVLSFPLILPLMMMAISGTKKALIPESAISLARMEIQVLASYVVVMTVLGFILFDSIWND